MKNIIFYFSGTGNSLKVAKDVANKLGNCEIVSMGKEVKISEEYGHIGFVFPTHGMNMPKFVRAFIKNTDFSKSSSAYFFSIATCGALSGNANHEANKILKEKSISLSYSNVVKMFSNDVLLYKMGEDTQEKREKSNLAIEDIADDIANNLKKKRQFYNPFFAMIANRPAEQIGKTSLHFNVSDKCTGCAKCSKICPVNNIQMIDHKPKFGNRCEQCVACIQWCPNEAINYKNKTQKRGRYHNPDIKYNEMTR